MLRIVSLLAFALVAADPFLQNYLPSAIANALILCVLWAAGCWYVLLPLAYSASARARLRDMRRNSSVGRTHAQLFAAFLAMLLVAILRAGAVNTLSPAVSVYLAGKWVGALVVLVGVGMMGSRANERDPIMKVVVQGLAVYALLNAALVMFGVGNEIVSNQYLGNVGNGLFFQLLGLTVQRRALPLGSGINATGLQAASGIAIALVLLKSAGLRRRWVTVLTLLACSVFCVMITDSRGGMFAAVLSAAAVIMVPSRQHSKLRWVALAIPVFPALLTAVSISFASNPLVAAITRSSDAESGALSGRALIWASIAGHYLRFRPVHVIGYGAFGQITSRVSDAYASLFEGGYASAVSAGAHNTLLQALLDTGYLGALVQMWLTFTLVSYYSKRVSDDGSEEHHLWEKVGLAATLYVIFGGMTGEMLSVSTPVTLMMFIGLNVSALYATRSRHHLP